MNGRVYDPTIGRFLSADPHIQDSKDSQSYNRYTYVKNNPLKYTDPSGFFFKSLWKKIKKWIKPIVAIAVAAVITWATMGAASPWAAGWLSAFGGSTFAATVATGALAGFASGLIMTGSLKGALKGALFGGLSAGIAYGIGNALSHDSSFFSALEKGNWGQAATKAMLHGISRSAITKLQGGRWSSGFWSGFAASAFSVGTEGKGGVVGRTMIMAVVGGTVSEITGGKFANGAVTGAFVHLFNAEQGFDNFIKRLKRAYNYSEVYYDNTIDSMTILTQNVGEKIAGFATVAKMNSDLSKNIFYKKQYGLLNVLKSKSSIPLYERIITRGLAPIFYGQTAFKSGVALGSGIKGLYYEFGR